MDAETMRLRKQFRDSFFYSAAIVFAMSAAYFIYSAVVLSANLIQEGEVKNFLLISDVVDAIPGTAGSINFAVAAVILSVATGTLGGALEARKQPIQ